MLPSIIDYQQRTPCRFPLSPPNPSPGSLSPSKPPPGPLPPSPLPQDPSEAVDLSSTLKGFNPKEIKQNAADILKSGAALYDALGQVGGRGGSGGEQESRVWLRGAVCLCKV